MKREVPWLSRDEFWVVIEDCRGHTADTSSFAERLPEQLVPWDFPRLGAFHNTMWYDVGVFQRGELWDVVREREPLLGSQNAWECYGGWLIAQGREFHEAVLRQPRLALSRLPSWEEIDDGESIIFAAQEACFRKTDRNYDLYDILGDFLPSDAFSR
jgi:hypothetical protein